MSNPLRHPDAEDLEQYSMGRSSLQAAALIEEHLLTCGVCRERLRETDEYRLAMRTAAEQVRRDARTATRREWSIPAWFPVLAAACVMLLVAVTLRLVRPDAPAVSVTLTALRGSGAGSSAPAGRELVLHPDLTGLAQDSAYRLEIVDLSGGTVRQGTFTRAQNSVKVQGLSRGLYFVRVYQPAGELLREYGLQIQ